MCPWGGPTSPSGLITEFQRKKNLSRRHMASVSEEDTQGCPLSKYINRHMNSHPHSHVPTHICTHVPYVLMSHVHSPYHKHGYKHAHAHTNNLVTLEKNDKKMEIHQSILLECWKWLTGQAKTVVQHETIYNKNLLLHNVMYFQDRELFHFGQGKLRKITRIVFICLILTGPWCHRVWII